MRWKQCCFIHWLALESASWFLLLGDCINPTNKTFLSFMQSFYEEQKREQMQGPALKRLEEEQQQVQTLPLVPSQPQQWQDSLHTNGTHGQEQQSPFAAESLPGSSDALQPSALQLNGAWSWTGSRRPLSQQPSVSQHRTSSDDAAVKMPSLHPSSKPPLSSRPRGQLSSEMSYLGGSASIGTAGHDLDTESYS